MKRLILMRHAKSDWSNESQPDHERPINKRGRRSARAMGDWLRRENISPDHVLCSDALRTQQTLAQLALEDVPVTFSRELYLAEPDVMIAALREAEDDCILMIGHNPGCPMLAEMLVSAAPEDNDFYRFPTCTTLVVDFDIGSWREMRMGSGETIHFIVPRALSE